jgi:nitric oxide reductase subunit B
MPRQLMPISRRWFQGAILTYLIGFTVLIVLAYLVYPDQPPLPAKVTAAGRTLFTRDDVITGMNVFQRYGLMEYGSIYGHGIRRYQDLPGGRLSAQERVAAELHENHYGRATPLDGAMRGQTPTGQWKTIIARSFQPRATIPV